MSFLELPWLGFQHLRDAFAEPDSVRLQERFTAAFFSENIRILRRTRAQGVDLGVPIPFHYTIFNGNVDVNTELTYTDFLAAAAIHGCARSLAFMLEVGKADVDMRFDFKNLGWSIEGATLLDMAVQSNHERRFSAVKYLLEEEGANPDGAQAKCPLWRAATSGNAKLGGLLLKAGANPDGTDADHIPLHIAVCNHDKEFVKLLTEARANPFLAASDGETDAFAVADRRGYGDMRAIMAHGPVATERALLADFDEKLPPAARLPAARLPEGQLAFAFAARARDEAPEKTRAPAASAPRRRA
jgi:hypothetical protein